MFPAKEVSQVAAKWWADLLRDETPSRISGTGQDDLVSQLQNNLARKTHNAPENVDLFEQRLSDAIYMRLLPRVSHDYQYEHIFFDYQPMILLEDVAKEAGVNFNGVPTKVDMYIREVGIDVQTSRQSLTRIWEPK